MADNAHLAAKFYRPIATTMNTAGQTGFVIIRAIRVLLTLPDFRRTLAVMASRKKQLSREEIHAMRGSLKRKPGDEQFTKANSRPSTCASWLTSFGGERLLLPKQFAPNKELLKRHAEKCLANS
jgi:hypothetical protein